MSDGFSYGDPEGLEKLINDARKYLIDDVEPGVWAKLRADTDQIITHHRVAGWSDVMIGALLMASLLNNSAVRIDAAIVIIADAVGIHKKG